MAHGITLQMRNMPKPTFGYVHQHNGEPARDIRRRMLGVPKRDRPPKADWQKSRLEPYVKPRKVDTDA